MAHNQINTNLTNLLFSFMNQPDPMLSMLEWLCNQMMEAEVTTQLNAEKANGRTTVGLPLWLSSP